MSARPTNCRFAKLLFAALMVTGIARAEDAAKPAGESKAAETKSTADGKPKKFTVDREITINGAPFAYTVTVGETAIGDKDGKPTAGIYTIAYMKKGVEDPTTRPVVFAFNGGPGSSSVWLHLGVLGPRRVRVPSDAQSAGAAPYPIDDNPTTLLAVADLVFIDPVGTGYSRAKEGSKDADFWGVDEDVASMAAFIRKFLTEQKRWNSPKYIVGESYGTIRASVLAGELQGGAGAVSLNGVVLVAPALDTRFILGFGTEMPYVTSLPTYAAAAWYHNALPNKPRDLKAFLRTVCDFASTEYMLALYKGDSLDADTKSKLADRLHEYTGISKNYWLNAKLRVNFPRFSRELLRERGLVLGGLDCRYTGTESDDVGETPRSDPFGAAIDAAFAAAMNDYLTREIGVELDRDYVIMSNQANGSWKRQAQGGTIFDGHLNVIPDLSGVARQNPEFRVLVADGYFDLVTTFFASEYMVAHSGIPADRITLKHYEAGHMMYLHEPSFALLADDLKAFIQVK